MTNPIEAQDPQGGETAAGAAWWAEHEIPEGQGIEGRIGALSLAVRHTAGEWRVSWQQDPQTADDAIDFGRPKPAADIEERAEVLRVVAGTIEGRLRIEPRLADRHVVARPETTFRLLPGSEICLYVSTPPWVALIFDDDVSQAVELPVKRPSDTWFGPSTAEGELCYSIRTLARLSWENLPLHGTRVATKVFFKNHTQESLSLERLSLPLPSLSLYTDSEGRLWTQEVHAESDSDGKMVEVDIGQGPPVEAVGARALVEPRDTTPKNVVVRTLDALLL